MLALYQAPPTLIATRNWDGRGDYPALGGDPSWGLTVLTNSLALPATAPALGVPLLPRTLELGVAGLTSTTLTIIGATGPVAVPLRAGLQVVRIPVTTPANLHMQTTGPPGDVAVRWATLRTSEAGPATAQPPLSDVLMLHIASQAQAGVVQTTVQRVDTRAAERQADRVVLDVYRSGGSGAADHFGYWAFALQGPTATFTVPLAGGSATGGLGATALPADSRRGPILAARYTASLTFYHGANVLDTVTDIYTFTAQPGAGAQVVITDVRVRALPLLFY